ncbi:MAG: hypothetical protein MR030_06265 [Bacteroidales bacterium]|nr:hypothetical protein [Bacteroidales bacterium]
MQFDLKSTGLAVVDIRAYIFSDRTLYEVLILTIYLSQGGALRACTVFLTAEAL